MSLLKANYYAEPDGQDAFGKMVATNKYAASVGLAWSVVDVLTVTKTQGYLPTLARIAYNTVPMMGMATAFTLTTYTATNLRNKDDGLNYFLGGMAAGGVYGAWKRHFVAGAVVGLFFGMVGVVKKLSKQEDWVFFPDSKHEYASVGNHDFTLLKDPPKNWKTTKSS